MSYALQQATHAWSNASVSAVSNAWVMREAMRQWLRSDCDILDCRERCIKRELVENCLVHHSTDSSQVFLIYTEVILILQKYTSFTYRYCRTWGFRRSPALERPPWVWDLLRPVSPNRLALLLPPLRSLSVSVILLSWPCELSGSSLSQVAFYLLY